MGIIACMLARVGTGPGAVLPGCIPAGGETFKQQTGLLLRAAGGVRYGQQHGWPTADQHQTTPIIVPKGACPFRKEDVAGFSDSQLSRHMVKRL